MDHSDHVALLRPAIPKAAANAIWADMGAGSGAFTLALADLLGPGAHVVAVDRDEVALDANRLALRSAFPGTELTTLVADFTRDLTLPLLDGLVAANSLHFVARSSQVAVIRALAEHLRPDGTFLIVEYDADSGNPWVPHPFSSRSWPALARAAGLVSAREIGRVPSRFLGAIYSASAQRSRD